MLKYLDIKAAHIFRVSLVVILSFVSFNGNAWIMDWAVRPFECTSLSRWNDGLYIVENDGKKGLIKSDGTILVPTQVDEITDPIGGYSLSIIKEGKKRRIKGVIDIDNKRYLTFEGSYYVYDPEFFSDGLMAVSDSKGRLGYIDIFGQEQIGFDSELKYIMPFTEGYAVVVSKDNKYELIDTNGVGYRKHMIFDFVAEIYGISNVFEGIAYLNERKTGKVFEFDINSHQIKKSNVPQKSFAKLDYLFCPDGITHRGTVPPTDPPVEPKRITNPVFENGLYGYVIDGTRVLPPQFGNAGPIEDGFAIVEDAGGKGILRCRDIAFQNIIKPEKDIFDCNAGENTEVAIDISTLAAGEHPLKFSLIDLRNNNVIEMRSDPESPNKFLFDYMPSDSIYEVRLDSYIDNLLISRDTLDLKFNIIQPTLLLKFSLSFSTRANSDDKIPVVATIQNPNDHDVATNVTLTSSSRCFVRKTEFVEIPAHGTIEIRSEFHITEEVRNVSVTVNAEEHGELTVKRSVLYPYY